MGKEGLETDVQLDPKTIIQICSPAYVTLPCDDVTVDKADVLGKIVGVENRGERSRLQVIILVWFLCLQEIFAKP